MTISVGVKREYEFTGNDANSDPCLFPRTPVNPVFVQAFDFKTRQIFGSDPRYLAFPFVLKIGSSLVGIFSDGDAHASSDKQIMFRTDDYFATAPSMVDFYVNATGAYDFSLLAGLMAPGDTKTFKVWTVKNTAGVFSGSIVSSVAYGGLTYAMWSKAVAAPASKLYRTGYATNGTDTQSALFESSDGGLTWAGKSVIFSGVGKLYNETDIVNTAGTNWMAICREDSGANNPLYKSTSTDDGATWSAATLLTTADINGRQPNLIKLADNSIILSSGDRSGSSGYGGSAGDQVSGFDTTGITVFRSTDAGSTWSYRTRVAPMYSTDGGQPFANETTAGRIAVVYYARRSTKTQPVIASASLDVANL